MGNPGHGRVPHTSRTLRCVGFGASEMRREQDQALLPGTLVIRARETIRTRE
jgi:hypothetical protein